MEIISIYDSHMTTPSDTLKSLNLKATPKRLAILEIMEGLERFISADELRARLRERFGRIGLPTVYRNLEELCRAGVITQVMQPDRKLNYCGSVEEGQAPLPGFWGNCAACRSESAKPGRIWVCVQLSRKYAFGKSKRCILKVRWGTMAHCARYLRQDDEEKQQRLELKAPNPAQWISEKAGSR